MNLEILSFEEAMKYVPPENSYGIRILDSSRRTYAPKLKQEKKWIDIKEYYFDDVWPKSWKEYSWIKEEEWEKLLSVEGKDYPKMNLESLKSFYESRGHIQGRSILFDEDLAKKILNDFENVQDKTENVMVHCTFGKNRSPAMGIAMNEIYGWGNEGLKEKFPHYRRYIYDVMVGASKTQ
jgi:hypothetical protein